jgi:hypothetical protein
MQIGRAFGEAAEDGARRRRAQLRQGLGDRGDRDLGGSIGGEPINASRYRGKSDSGEAMLSGKLERAAIAGCEQDRLAGAAAAPDRPNGMNDVTGLQVETGRDLGLARRAAAEPKAGRQQLRPGGAVDGALDAAAAGELRIGGVDDRIDIERRDVGDEDFETGRRDFRPWRVGSLRRPLQ